MDNDKQAISEEPLNDSQRIELLENARKLDRLFLMALGGVLLVILASWFTYALLVLSGDDETASSQTVAVLQQQVDALDSQVATLKQQLTEQQTTLEQNRSAPGAAGTDDPAVAKQVARTLIGQERNFQQSLAALKLGMRDLAGMIPGSRSWLSAYHEALDVPLIDSRARMKELEHWAGAVPAKEPAAEAAPAATPAPAP